MTLIPLVTAVACPALQYRTLRNYRSMEYLGPRLFDKIIFAIVIMVRESSCPFG